MDKKQKRQSKLERLKKVLLGRSKAKVIKKHTKKTEPTPKNPQKPNWARRKARAIGTDKAWSKFRALRRREEKLARNEANA